MLAVHKSHTIDMTEGTIWKLLVAFAVPLLIGNLFQQMYNTVDSLILGNFVGKSALAAVGSTTCIVNTFIRFFNGVSIGSGIVISQYFGAKDWEKLHETIETAMAVTFIVSVVFTFLGVTMTPWILHAISTPEDVFVPAQKYLQIYFFGISTVAIYNIGAAVMRAIGDTRRPLYFLALTSVLNIILDLVFVLLLHMDIAGVAYATVISQAVSAVLVMVALCRAEKEYRFTWRDLRINGQILKKIVALGIPTGIQQALTAFSNVFVNAYINAFGSACMAGWSCYVKIDQFLMLPVQSTGQAVVTFVSQNIGAGKEERARRGSRVALVLALCVILSISALLWITAPFMVQLFTRDVEVVEYGSRFLRLIVFFTVGCCFNQVYGGSLRGRGNATGPMCIMLFSFVLARQIYLFAITRFVHNPYVVGFGYPVGWIVCATMITLYYRRYLRKYDERRNDG